MVYLISSTENLIAVLRNTLSDIQAVYRHSPNSVCLAIDAPMEILQWMFSRVRQKQLKVNQ